MRIGRVEISNFRNFRHLQLEQFPASAILVGENGIGKSNFLHALRLVLDPDLPDSARRLRAEDICELSEGDLATGVEVRVQVDLIEIEGDLDSEALCDGCYSNLDPLTARLTYTFRPKQGRAGSTTQLTRFDYEWQIAGGTEETTDARRFRRELSVTVLPALRDASDELSRYRGSALHELLEARPPDDSTLSAVAAEVNKAMDKLSENKNVKSVAADLSTRIGDLAGPRLDIEPTLGFASSVPSKLLRSIRLYVDRNRTRTVGDTSTGNANVVYLGMLLERLNSRRDNDVIVDAVLAVEEPEAHIHPVLQRQLFRYLLSNEPSLIVSTHSPHIVAVSRLESVVLLRASRSDGSTVGTTIGPLALSEKDNNDLERYLDVTRAEVLFCNAVIFVEGVSELYLLPEIATALDFDLDSYGVVVSSVGGTDFRPYRRLTSLAGLAIENIVVTDGDPTDKTETGLDGLRRAEGLILDQTLAAEYRVQINSLAKDSQISWQRQTDSIRLAAADSGIYVGAETLELDITSLVGDSMIQAMNDLEDSTTLQAKFATAVRAVENEGGPQDQREEILRRIKYVSKGRFAQRLANRIAEDHSPLRSKIEIAVKSSVTEAAIDAVRQTDSDGPGNVRVNWLDSGSFGYILAALDSVSWSTRGHGILTDELDTEVEVQVQLMIEAQT